MARETNRKSAGVSYAPTVNSAVLVCLAVAVAALGRIRLKSEENRLYSEINRVEFQIQELRRSNRKLQVDYEILTSPAGLSGRIREMRLDLVMPGEDARVVLPEPATDTPFPQALVLHPTGAAGQLALTPGRGGSARRTP